MNSRLHKEVTELVATEGGELYPWRAIVSFPHAPQS